MGARATDEARTGDVAPATHADLPRGGRLWVVAWLLSVTFTLVALALSFPQNLWPMTPALLVGAFPAALTLVASRYRLRLGPGWLLAIWGAAGGLACILAGGVAGPLAVWCLAPVAAAAAMGGGRRIAEGAALALMAAAVSAVATLAGLTPSAPTGMTAFWMAFLALATTGVGLGAGLILAERRVNLREARLDDDMERLRTVLDEQPHLILTLFPNGRVRGLFGRAPAGVSAAAIQAKGLTAASQEAGRPALERGLERALAEGGAEIGFAPAGALDRWVSVTLRGVEENLLLAVMRDATADRDHLAAMEQGRQDAENLAAGKSRFLANMSHELRTPLNAIMGFSDIMRSSMFGPLPGKYSEYGELIHDAGRHLLDLINDVLDMSKIEAERFELSREPFDGREAVSAALRLMRVQADGVGVQLRGVIPSEPLEVEADRRAIKQIVLNLVSNALKFTPKGGTVTLTLHGYDGVFELIVADTGVGISKDDLDRLGKPYEQVGDPARRQMGTGLGLSLVRSFAELHGGEMMIESTVGRGTSVTVRLPVLSRPEVAPPPAASGNIIAFNPHR
ncbi:MAG: HAMP domain-containing sensor histidine kinase [Caulobacter sp.]|nr:HAMP domain-containing sensor histidine kinase [Caulobacter sp.]